MLNSTRTPAQTALINRLALGVVELGGAEYQDEVLESLAGLPGHVAIAMLSDEISELEHRA
jgi:hypothetical protein